MIPSTVEHEELSDEERDMIVFMAKRMGWDHFIIAGYDSEEFNKHILSKGLYEGGAPKVGVTGHLAGLAFIIARILCDYPFSDELRRGVHSVINTVLTGREIRENQRKKGD